MIPAVLPELRCRRFWLAAGFAIAAAIAVVCWLPARELPSSRLSDKHQHLLAFGALAFWFGSIVVRRGLAWLAVVLLAFGALIEAGQGLMGLGRSAEWLDFVADAAGVVLGLLLSLTPLSRWPAWLEARLAGAVR